MQQVQDRDVQDKDVERQPLMEQPPRTTSKKIWAIPILLFVILAVTIPLAIVYSARSVDMTAAAWMESLNNETAINRVSMPGTHNSGALYGSANSQCQVKSLHEQLIDGVRFFDIHLYHYNDVLRVYQNMVDEHITFPAVQSVFIDYLNHFPSEVIVVRFKEEHIDYPGYVPPASDGNTKTFKDQILHDMAPYMEHYWQNGSFPTVGEARGKIVQLCDYQNFNATACIDYNEVLDQDDYTIDSCDEIPIKFQGILHQIDYGLRGSHDDWYLNYCSAVVSYHNLGWANRACTPRDIASGINGRLYDHLKNNASITYLGIVAMDFEYPALNKLIYSRNDFEAPSLAQSLYRKWQAMTM